MAKTTEQRLKDLYEKRRAVEDQIKQIEQEKAAELRKRQQQRQQIIGRVIYKLVESGEWTEQQLLELLNPHVNRTAERRLFGLETPTKAKSKQASEKPKSEVSSPSPASIETDRGSNQATASDSPSPNGKKSTISPKSAASLPEPDNQDELEKQFNL